MKKLFLIFTIMPFLFACKETNTQSDKAKELIENELKKRMNDWSSYEFVEMKFDSIFTYKNLYRSYEKKTRLQLNTNIRLDTIDLKITIEDYQKRDGKTWKDLAEEYTKELNEFKNIQRNTEFVGYKARFTFRGNNKLGIKIINTYDYYIDKDILFIEEVKKPNDDF